MRLDITEILRKKSKNRSESILILSNLLIFNAKFGVPKGIRTPVTAVKGRCPRPLDDGDMITYIGASRDRTGDLLHAMQALSQLSYSPGVYLQKKTRFYEANSTLSMIIKRNSKALTHQK